MNLKEKWNKLKNAKYMWDISRVNVMIDDNDNSWVATKDYEYLAKRYKNMYLNMAFLMFGILVLAIFMMW